MNLELIIKLVEDLNTAFPWLNKIQNKEQHSEALDLLQLLIEHGDMFVPMVRLISNAIEEYESGLLEVQLLDENTGSLVTGLPALTLLMSSHNLKNVDMVEILGSPSLVSQIINGKRNLTIAQIKKLAEFFNVPPGFFL